jgi:hypothetical protein
MTRRLSAQNRKLILCAFIIAVPIYVITHYDWTIALICISTMLFVPAWYLTLRMPTQCRVATVKGHPCRNRAYGVIFGCKQYHYLMKARVRIGKSEQDAPQPAPNGYRQKTGGAALGTHGDTRQVVVVRIEEGAKGHIAFCFAILSDLCTVVPVVVVAFKLVVSLF